MKTNRSADIPVRRDAETRSVPGKEVAVGNRALLRTRVPVNSENRNSKSEVGGGAQRSARPTLKNEFGFWELAWGERCAVLRCEPGVAYVAWLLENRPSEPISALELAAKVSGVTCPCFGSGEVFHPDAAAARLFWLRKQKELEALVDCEDTLEPVREETLRELEAIYAYQRRNADRVNRDAQFAARAVAKAIEDFCGNLERAWTVLGEVHGLAREFGKYVREHVCERDSSWGWE